LLNEELHSLYASPIKSRKMRLAEHAARIGDMRNAYQILVGNPEGKERLYY